MRTLAHELVFLEPHLNSQTAALAAGCSGVCAFVNDHLDAAALETLAQTGIRLIALRSAGFNNVDLVARNSSAWWWRACPRIRRTPWPSTRWRSCWRSIENCRAPTCGCATAILRWTASWGSTCTAARWGSSALDASAPSSRASCNGFGCRLVAFDRQQNSECVALGVEYVELQRLFAEADIISLHAPLTPETRHLIDKDSVRLMKRGVMIINTGRGALVDTKAVIDGLKSGHIGFLGLDVYEEEEELFFEDRSGQIIQDDVFTRLLSFPNVIVTAHQAFFTGEALHNIAETTLANITAFETGAGTLHRVRPEQ